MRRWRSIFPSRASARRATAGVELTCRSTSAACAARCPRPAPTSSATAGTRRASRWRTTARARRRCSSTPARGCCRRSRCWTARRTTGALLLSHLHWDHVVGPAVLLGRPTATARASTCCCPSRRTAPTRRAALGGLMSPPYFPIGPLQLCGELDVLDAARGRARGRGLQRARARDPAQGRAHVRLPRQRRRRDDRVHARPQPDGARPRRGRPRRVPPGRARARARRRPARARRAAAARGARRRSATSGTRRPTTRWRSPSAPARARWRCSTTAWTAPTTNSTRSRRGWADAPSGQRRQPRASCCTSSRGALDSAGGGGGAVGSAPSPPGVLAREVLLDRRGVLAGALGDAQQVAHRRDLLDLLLDEPLHELLGGVVAGSRARSRRAR